MYKNNVSRQSPYLCAGKKPKVNTNQNKPKKPKAKKPKNKPRPFKNAILDMFEFQD